MGNKIVVKGVGSKELTDYEINALQKASKLSVDRIKELHQAFMENNPTGKMNKTQFKEMLQAFKGETDENADSLYQNVFAAFDANRDGYIDFKEFVLHVGLKESNDVDSKIEFFFKMCDLSGDGYVNHKELADFITSAATFNGNKTVTPELARETASFMFADLGLGNHSKISKEQFIKGCRENPTWYKVFSKQQQ